MGGLLGLGESSMMLGKKACMEVELYSQYTEYGEEGEAAVSSEGFTWRAKGMK